MISFIRNAPNRQIYRDRVVVAQGGEAGWKRQLMGDGNVLKMTIVMVTQLYEYTKDYFTFQSSELSDM